MTKTLADYTPEERREMIGTWCNHKDERHGEALAVITNIVWIRGDDNRTGQVAMLYWPREKHHSIAGETLETVTPRFDLPRAWDPDGNPVKGYWEEATVCHYGDDDLDVRDPDGNSLDVSAFTNTDEFYRDGQVVGRRFVTKWEESLA